MDLTPWDPGPTECVDVEVHLRGMTPTGYPALLMVPFVGTFTEYLTEPPVHDLRTAAAAAGSFGEPAPHLYGRLLFEWLFVDRLREGFLMARQAAADPALQRWRFRLRFGDRTVETADLADLRWEALVYQKEEWRLGLETGFARARSPSRIQAALVNDRPLRLFAAVTAGAATAGGDPLDGFLPAFQRNVTRPLGDLVDAAFAYPRLTFRQFAAALHQGPRHCVVLGAPVRAGGPGAEMLFDAPGAGVEAVPWRAVAEEICRHRPPDLVVVVGPGAGGPWDPAGPLVRLAPALHDGGVRAVVELIGPTAAAVYRAFGEAFFNRVLQTGRIDEAVAIGRRALFIADKCGWDWACPVLSLQGGSDGQLFHLLPEDVERDLRSLRSAKGPAGGPDRY